MYKPGVAKLSVVKSTGHVSVLISCMCQLQKLLSSFKGLDTVQGYDGSQSVASIPSEFPIPADHASCFVRVKTAFVHLLVNFDDYVLPLSEAMLQPRKHMVFCVASRQGR